MLANEWMKAACGEEVEDDLSDDATYCTSGMIPGIPGRQGACSVYSGSNVAVARVCRTYRYSMCTSLESTTGPVCIEHLREINSAVGTELSSLHTYEVEEIFSPRETGVPVEEVLAATEAEGVRGPTPHE